VEESTNNRESELSDVDPEALTIAQAAARLGVSERTLYRLLKAPETAARTLTGERQTATGRRQTTLLPPELVNDLAARFEGERTPAPNADTTEKNTGTNADNDAGSNGDNTSAVSVEGEAPGPLVRALIGQYEARIADLKSEVEALRAALEREQMNHARTQTLRALATPVAPAPNSPQEAPEAPYMSEAAEQEAEAGQRQEGDTGSGPKRRGWWPWGRKDERQ